MGKETFIAYWSGQEPTGPDRSPTLAQMPDTVDLVVLFWASINPNGDLNFSELVDQNDQATIMEWMAEIRERQQGQPRRTKFLLSINSELLNQQDPDKFAKKVKDAARSWGVDGIDIDFEPPHSNPPVMPVIKAIKDALPAGSLLTAPIYRPWNDHANLKRQLASYAALFDYVMTMDYTPCGSYEDTIRLYEAYAQAMGGDVAAYGKLAIGVSCMEFDNDNHTPLDDVKKLCAYEPPVKGASKLGAMLYTLSYDAPGHGSPYPLFTYTKAIADNLP
jgi:Glycosyl hydrolases family 18